MPTTKPRQLAFQTVATCHDCGAQEGQIHERGCDMERCPFCGGQLIGCECSYKHFGYEIDRDKPLSGLPREVYENGLPDEQADEWERVLERKGRVPYIRWPVLCAYCGKAWSEMFWVPDKEWKKYVQKSMRRKVLCRPCYDHIKSLIDAGEEAERAAEAMLADVAAKQDDREPNAWDETAPGKVPF